MSVGDSETLNVDVLKRMFVEAWRVRDLARVLGATRVGCAALSADGAISVGCNIEHRFRSHDIHAEVNAISSMVAAGRQDLLAVAIASERERFTPCGACLDWIFELGGDACLVAWQRDPTAEPVVMSAAQLMPYYPR